MYYICYCKIFIRFTEMNREKKQIIVVGCSSSSSSSSSLAIPHIFCTKKPFSFFLASIKVNKFVLSGKFKFVIYICIF